MVNTEQPTVESYLRTQIAPRFGQIVAEAPPGDAADLRAACGSIGWEVSGDGGGMWYLNIADGAMTVAGAPSEPPFMHVLQSLADWQRFISGAVTPGFLGGGPSRRGLGKARIERLKSVKGSLRFVITGLADGGRWSFVTRFGPGPFPPEPQATVTVGAAAMQQMQSGELSAQMAFMQGKVQLAGDAGVAMQLGMVMFA